MTVDTLEEAKTRMEELAHLAAHGEGIRISVDGGVQLELRAAAPALPSAGKRVGGQWAGLVHFAPDTFDPMPEDWLAAFYHGPVFPSEDSESSKSAERDPK
jgi:hypothetical protein